MANGRCRLHGGKSLAGVAAPAFRHGRYSRVLPTGLADVYHRLLATDDLVALHDELALLQARVAELCARLDDGGDARAIWEEVRATVDQLRRVAEVELKRRRDAREVLTAEQALALAAALAETVNTHVHDRALRAAIGRDLDRLLRGGALCPPAVHH